MSSSFADSLRAAMKSRDMTISDLAIRSGVSNSSISEYLKGKNEAKRENIFLLAQALRISPAILLGAKSITTDSEIRTIPILRKIEMTRPIIAEEHIERYECTNTMNLDFGFIVPDNSMIHVRLREGDIAYVDQIIKIENGDIVVTIPKGCSEARIRYYARYGSKIVFRTAEYNAQEEVYNMRDVRVIGKVVRVMFNV